MQVIVIIILISSIWLMPYSSLIPTAMMIDFIADNIIVILNGANNIIII